MEVRLNAQSQTHRLRERMQEAAVAHGDVVRADLRNVRVTVPLGSSVAELFFCNMQPLQIWAREARGDGGPLPHDVELESGLQVPGAGVYDLLNVRLSSNGALRVATDAGTRVVLAAFSAVGAESRWTDRSGVFSGA